MLREQAIKYESFPYDGKWLMTEESNDKQWDSNSCRLNNSVDKSQQMIQWDRCTKVHNISHIVMLGDSNGAKYNTAMLAYLKDVLNATCTRKKMEKSKSMRPDPSYFSLNSSVRLQNIVSHERDCSTCKSTLSECHLDNSTFTITLEYIAMEYVLDNEVITFRSRTYCKKVKRKPCDYSITYQEFLFKEYLSGNYPDILMIFMNSHDSSRKSGAKITKDTEYFSSILSTYLPPHTTTVWFNALSQYRKNKPREFQQDNATDLITETNRAVFKGLVPSLKREKSHTFCFFDIEKMSIQVLPFWNKDGVHIKPIWYTKIINNFFEVLCSQV